MSAERSRSGPDEIGRPAPPAGSPEQQASELARLGEALEARAECVRERTVARTIDSGEVVDALVQESFERVCVGSTAAVARWIAGEPIEVTNEAERESSTIVGELAAHRAASMN